MALGVTRQLLRKRNQVLPLERRTASFGLHLEFNMIAQAVANRNLCYILQP
jgi:hypothetical protein